MSEYSAEHTPEPWRTAHSEPAEGADVWWIVAGEGNQETELGSLPGGLKANARRIVAAVNACAGIPTESLEQGVVAKLVEALETVANDAERRGDFSSPHSTLAVVRAALSLAREPQP